MAQIRAIVILSFALAGWVPAGCGGGSGAGPQASSGQSAIGSSSSPATPAAEVFALMDPGETEASLERYAALDTVDGLAFRTLWRQLEPQNGTYDWSALDTALDVVRPHGKKLTVHIGVSGGAWPQWLQTAGMATYHYNTSFGSGDDPVPWDAVLLTRYGLLLSALAAHVRARGETAQLRAVSDGVPVGEMSLVACRGGMLGTLVYDRASYLQAWKTTVSAHAAAFPTVPTFVSAPVSTICFPDTDGRAFYSDLMNYALTLGRQLGVFVADLDATGSNRLRQVDPALLQNLPLAAQSLGPTGGALRDAVCQGLAAGARYFELYKADLSSSGATVQEAVRLARQGRICTG